jgi:glycosyltransferase involved in cell wall biosynthesis
VDVVERHEPVWEGRRDAWRAGVWTAARLARAQLRLTQHVDGSFDAVVVGYPGHVDVLAARRACPDTPLVLNPLVSLFDTFVHDRRRFGPRSLAARALTAVDRRAFRTADVVVADTAAHAEVFASLGARRVEVCFVGAEERVFHPGDDRREQTALFVGKLIPLHGVETVLAAAAFAPDIPLRIVGSGQLERLLASTPANVEWVPWVEYELLGGEYRRAGCALGVFGTSAKAARVIPNKAFQALACGTPLVTADTPAARELLVHGESALLVPAGDPLALADAIQSAIGNERIGAGGLSAFRERASEDVLASRWREIVAQAAG